MPTSAENSGNLGLSLFPCHTHSSHQSSPCPQGIRQVLDFISNITTRGQPSYTKKFRFQRGCPFCIQTKPQQSQALNPKKKALLTPGDAALQEGLRTAEPTAKILDHSAKNIPGGAFRTGTSRINFSFQLGHYPVQDGGENGSTALAQASPSYWRGLQSGEKKLGSRIRRQDEANFTESLDMRQEQRCPFKKGLGITWENALSRLEEIIAKLQVMEAGLGVKC